MAARLSESGAGPGSVFRPEGADAVAEKVGGVSEYANNFKFLAHTLTATTGDFCLGPRHLHQRLDDRAVL